MASTNANGVITLDIQGSEQSQSHGNAIDNLINALNKFTERVDRINPTNAKDDSLSRIFEKILLGQEKQSWANSASSRWNLDHKESLFENSLIKSNKYFMNDFNNAINEYNESQMKSAQNLKRFGSAMIDITGNLIGDASQYIKASNALIGATPYDVGLRKAQKEIQENTAINKGIADTAGGLIGGGIGALAGLGNPLAIAAGSYLGAKSAESVADIFSSQYEGKRTVQSQIEQQQKNIAGITQQKLIDFINPETNEKFKTTQAFADIANQKGMSSALAYQAAQQGVLLNTTGTQSISGAGSINLAREISDRTEKIYNSDQMQQLGSVMSGVFAHSGLTDNSKKQADILQKILDNSAKYGVDPIQYAQQIYQRQQFMGGSPEDAMKFANMGVVQGWTYANTIQNMERAPVSQRLATTFALQMVGYNGTYEDLFKEGGIDKLEKKAGNLKDPYNFNAMVLQGAGLDLWSLKSGASSKEAQDENTKALMDNAQALENLTNAILGKSSSEMSINPMSNNIKNYESLSNAIGSHTLNSSAEAVKNGKDWMVPPIMVTKVTH